MTRETMTWEQRVEALELDADMRADLVGSIRGELEARDVKIQGLEATVAGLQAAEDVRRKRAEDAYVDDLVARCVAAQKPLAAEDRQKVEAAFARGDEETARTLGEAFVSRAEALAKAEGRPAPGAGLATTKTNLGPVDADHKAQAAFVAQLLKDGGKDVRISEDGLHVYEGDRRIL